MHKQAILLLDFTLDRWASCTNIVFNLVPVCPILTLIERFALLSWSTVDGEGEQGKMKEGEGQEVGSHEREREAKVLFINFTGALLLSYRGLQAG